MPAKLAVELGQRYGRLVVVGEAPKIGRNHQWKCVCDCGREKVAAVCRLRCGDTRSCGCLLREVSAEWAKDGLRPYRPKIRDLTGQRFGKWLVLGPSPADPTPGTLRWDCRCDCGTTRSVAGPHLKKGTSKSCGDCIRGEALAARWAGHVRKGRAGPCREYRIWSSMKTRCNNPKATSYKWYGARGIKVCERWAGSYAAFRDDVGPIPEGLSLDRIDNDGDYEPGNVRLATVSEQSRNRRCCKQHRE